MKIKKEITMGRFGLRKKLFIGLSISFLLIIIAVFIGMMYYFEPYFINKQISIVENDIVSYLNSKKEDLNDINKLDDIVTEYSSANTNPIAIHKYDISFFAKRSYSIVLEHDSNFITVELGDAWFQLRNRGIEIEKGMTLSFVGFKNKDRFLGLSIYDFKDYDLRKAYMRYGRKASEIIKLTGIVVDYDLPVYETGSLYKQDKMYEFMQSNEFNNNKDMHSNRVIIENMDTETGIKNYLMIIPYEDALVITMYNLQPVKELLSAMPEFFSYTIILIILLVFLLILFSTRSVVNPILKINNVAQKISNLDFSDRLDIDSQDEIGMICTSINTMADKLEETMDTLEKQNLLLKEKLIEKEKFELIRKKFIAEVSHELKTPLGIIRAYTERVEDKYIENEKGKYYTGVILDENLKMDKLINDLLELSKLEVKHNVLQWSKYNISLEVDKIVNRFVQMFEDKKIKFHIDVSTSVYIRADKERMNQVLTNMISNAFKYTPECGSIQVNLQSSEDYIIFSIINDIDNIYTIDIDRIWERFYRADTARSRKTGSAGLGLAISKRILDLHEFEYGVSKMDEKIEFYIKIPIKS